MVVQALTDSSAGMDNGKLFILVTGLLDQRGLEAVEDHTESGSGSSTLSVVLVRLTVNVLLQYNISALGQGRFQILGNSDHAHALLLADVQNGEQLLRFAAAGSEYHYIAFAQEAGCTVY